MRASNDGPIRGDGAKLEKCRKRTKPPGRWAGCGPQRTSFAPLRTANKANLRNVRASAWPLRGFARGIAHIGVLRVLREAGIPIDCVAGTSVGALIAVGYCAGASLDLMTEVVASTSFTDFGRWTPSWLGLATNQRMEKYIARFTPVKTFEELQTPLAIATTDNTAGVSVYYSHGPIAPPL